MYGQELTQKGGSLEIMCLMRIWHFALVTSMVVRLDSTAKLEMMMDTTMTCQMVAHT